MSIDYCANITCLNNGVCQSSSRSYQCQCLYGTRGIHCEETETTLIVRRYASKSVSYILIIVFVVFAIFIITLDILKYVFDINITEQDRKEIRRQKRTNQPQGTYLKSYIL